MGIFSVQNQFLRPKIQNTVYTLNQTMRKTFLNNVLNSVHMKKVFHKNMHNFDSSDQRFFSEDKKNPLRGFIWMQISVEPHLPHIE